MKNNLRQSYLGSSGSTFLMIILFFDCLILGEELNGTQFYLGDINSDNILNIQDIIIIINLILS